MIPGQNLTRNTYSPTELEGHVDDNANHHHTAYDAGPRRYVSSNSNNSLICALVGHYGQKGHLLRSTRLPLAVQQAKSGLVFREKNSLTAAWHPPTLKDRFQLLGTAGAIDRDPEHYFQVTGPVSSFAFPLARSFPSLSLTSTLALCRVTQEEIWSHTTN
jgi:hypothetical protein